MLTDLSSSSSCSTRRCRSSSCSPSWVIWPSRPARSDSARSDRSCSPDSCAASSSSCCRVSCASRSLCSCSEFRDSANSLYTGTGDRGRSAALLLRAQRLGQLSLCLRGVMYGKAMKRSSQPANALTYKRSRRFKIITQAKKQLNMRKEMFVVMLVQDSNFQALCSCMPLTRARPGSEPPSHGRGGGT